jgi:hypothetical protein
LNQFLLDFRVNKKNYKGTPAQAKFQMYKFIFVILIAVSFQHSLFFMSVYVLIGFFYFNLYYFKMSLSLENSKVAPDLFSKLKKKILNFLIYYKSIFRNIVIS